MYIIYIYLYKYDIVAINAINIMFYFLLNILTIQVDVYYQLYTIIYCVHQSHFLLGALWCKQAAARHK